VEAHIAAGQNGRENGVARVNSWRREAGVGRGERESGTKITLYGDSRE